MAYNKDVLTKAGVDPTTIKTWADFMAACDKVKTTKAADYCFTPSAKYPGEFYYNWGTMVGSQGVDLFDKDGAPIFQNNSLALGTFQMIKDGIDKGYFDKAGIDMTDYETLIEFGKGQDAFLLDSTWSVTNANTNKDVSTIMGKVGLMLIPGSDKVRSGGYLYAGGIGVLKSSAHKAEAKQFLTYFTGDDAQKWHAVKGANMPTRVALYKDKDIAASWSGFETLAEQLGYGKFPPQFGWFEEWRHSLSSAIQDVITGNKTPDAAVKFLVDEATRLKAK
jgi:ABC-type glycerol-3-phosphate transport system substrate-binding protein